MNTRRTILLMLLLAVLPTVSMYAYEIKGRVVDSRSGKPIELASILLKNHADKIVSYGSSSSDGEFSIVLPGSVEVDSVTLEVRMLGYSMVCINSPFPEYINVDLEEVYEELSEVVVKAKKVEKDNDTITYYIPALVSADDKKLGDVLAKLPGISVDKAGYVKVYGKSINKFYIEGSDLLEHRYNIATENIDPNDIKEVKVYENHQPVRALEGIVESDRAAIDIILKDGAKAKWLGTLQAEAGGSTQSPWIPYSAAGMLMNISKKFQTINVLKTDAAGNTVTTVLNNTELSTDLNNFDFFSRYVPFAYLGVRHNTAPIDDARTKFNTTYSASTNNKFNVGRKKQVVIGVSALYENEVLNSWNSNFQRYEMADGDSLSFYEENGIRSRAYMGYGNINATINTQELYLRENFQIEFAGNKASNHLRGTKVRDEETNVNSINVLNNLRFIKGLERTSFCIENFTQYSEQQEYLVILSSEEGKETVQEINGRYFFNTLKYNFSYSPVKWFSLHSYSNVDYMNRNFNSVLSGLKFPEMQADTTNAVNLWYLKPYETLRMEFSTKKNQGNGKCRYMVSIH